MKSTDNFKQTIQSYLENRAQTDLLFAAKFGNPDKNIDDCVTYILNTVQKSGCAGYTGDEVFSMAVHYYDEESIEIGMPIICKVVVNHAVELTEQNKEEAHAAAIKQYQDEAYNSLKKKSVKKEKVSVQLNSLFGDED